MTTPPRTSVVPPKEALDQLIVTGESPPSNTSSPLYVTPTTPPLSQSPPSSLLSSGLKNTDTNGELKSDDKLPQSQSVEFSCAYLARILLHGRMLIFEDHLEFKSNILGHKTDLSIPFEEISDCTKRNSAYVVPNAIEIMTKSHVVHFFSSFSNRDQAFALIHGYWIKGMKSLYEPYKLSKLDANTSTGEIRRTLSLDVPSNITNIAPYRPARPPPTSPQSSPPESSSILEHTETELPKFSSPVKVNSPPTSPVKVNSPKLSPPATVSPLKKGGSSPDVKRHESLSDLKRRDSTLSEKIASPTEDKKANDELPSISITEPPNPPHSSVDYLDKLDELDQDQINDIFQTTAKLQQAFPSIKYPTSTMQLFELLFSNASNFVREYHEAVNDMDIVIDEWVDVNVSGVPIARCVNYKVDSKHSALGSLFSKPIANVIETERMALTKNKQNTQSCIVLHSSLTTQNLSRDEMFQVETKFFVVDTRKSTSLRKECKLEIFVGAHCKGAFWKNSAEANAIKAAKKRIETWLELAQKYVQKYHKRKMEARYDQERAALEANVIAAMAQIENVPTSVTKLLLPIPPLLHPSPPPSPRQRKRLQETYSHEELMKPEMPLPAIGRGTHNLNHRHMHFSTDDKRLKQEYIDGYTHHDVLQPVSAHWDDEDDEMFVDGHWIEPTAVEIDDTILLENVKPKHVSVSSPTTPAQAESKRHVRTNSESSIASMELVDMLVQPKSDSFRLFEEPAPNAKPTEEVVPKIDDKKPEVILETKPEPVKVEEPVSHESKLQVVMEILQLVIGALMGAVSQGISFVQRHGATTIVYVTLFAVLWAVYYNIRINREFNNLTTELSKQTKDSRAQFKLAQEILSLTEKDYDSEAIRHKILEYMIENDKVVPPILTDELEGDEEPQGPTYEEMLNLVRQEIKEIQEKKT